MLLVIDNYDSFVHNLARYFQQLGQQTLVVRNDAIDVPQVRTLAPAAIVLSPGPCAPEQAGASLDIVRQCHQQFPILGVCLGHQTIAQALGGIITRANKPMHGRASHVIHQGHPLFANVPTPFSAGRYHSLVVDPGALPADLEIIARTSDDVVMALAHRTLPVVGVQFHPESVLTACGYQLLSNFLRLAALPVDRDTTELAAPVTTAAEFRMPQHSHPLTF